jgi:hypothetical protein
MRTCSFCSLRNRENGLQYGVLVKRRFEVGDKVRVARHAAGDVCARSEG